MDELLTTFGLNLKMQRIKHKLSQEKLAEALNFSTVYVSNVECGKHNISLVNAVKFCKFFNLPVEKFINQNF